MAAEIPQEAPLHRERAEQCVERAAQSVSAGKATDALEQWRQATLHYAEAYRLVEASGSVALELTRARAHACRYYGDALARQQQHAEATNIFQEAADLYGLLHDAADREHARECARKALAGIAALRSDPHNRLYLLIARYQRQQQQFALQPGTWAQQADCCLRIAQIFLRRDHPEDACARYSEALELYRHAEPTEAIQLAQAECHHRIGNLLANVLIDEPNGLDRALAHYDAALSLYQSPEPLMQENLVLCAAARADLLRRMEK